MTEYLIEARNLVRQFGRRQERITAVDPGISYIEGKGYGLMAVQKGMILKPIV